MSNLPPISFRPGQPAPSQFTSNMMAFNPGSYNPSMPYGAQYQQPQYQQQPPQFGMPIPGGSAFGSNFNLEPPRQTFFNRSTTGMMQQTSSYQHINHLKNVMPCLEKEFKSSGVNVVIINNAENPGSKNFDLSIDVEAMVKVGDKDMPIKLQLPKEFPNQTPTLFSKIGLSHKIINKLSQEIDFKQYYPWDKKTSKAVDLIKATERYFNENSPFQNLEEKKFDTILENIEDRAVSKLKDLEVRAFFNNLSVDDKKTVANNDQLKTIELIKQSSEYKQADDSRTMLTKSIGLLTQSIHKEVNNAEVVYKDMKKAQALTEETTTELNNLYTSVAVESQRFDKNNVVHSLEQYSKKLEENCMTEMLTEQLKAACDKISLDKTLTDFIKKRTEFNKLLIIKGKLTGVQLQAAT